jgi:hypothetical protein
VPGLIISVCFVTLLRLFAKERVLE